MDKKTLLGISLIAVVMIAWMMYSSSVRKEIPPEQTSNTEQNQIDSVQKDEQIVDKKNISAVPTEEKFGQMFLPFATGTEHYIRIITDNYSTLISNKGGAIVRWELLRYSKWDAVPAQLINYKEKELYTEFTTFEAKKIDSRDLYFKVTDENGKDVDLQQVIKLKGKEKKSLTFSLDLGDGKEIKKCITLQGDKYHIDQDILINNLDNIIKGGYSLIWGHNLNYQEKHSDDESRYSNALISMNGSVDEFDNDDAEKETQQYTGIVDYVAIKTKYFTTAIIPQPWKKFDGSVTITGQASEAKNNGKLEDYSMSIDVPYKGGKQKNSFKIFIGPIDYKLVESYGLEGTVDLGWKYLIRPIAEYLMIPLFNAVHSFVPNYGIAIILFSFLMKIILYPLSLKQVRNASYMKLLAPEIEKLKEKHKDDPKQQQMDTMQVYAEYGINPASGCLPLLIQMPILFALWRTLNGSIDLRQQPFILWITDLSSPDVLFSWGFSVLGLTHISGLAVLMAVAMFLQQKMTITDPKQKAMVYMMPIMFLFMFSNFPSGLNLYYFVFNLLAIAQQLYVNNVSSKKVTLADLKKAPKKKEGWMAKQMRMAQEMQKSGGRPLPPSVQKYMDAKQGNAQPNPNNSNGKGKHQNYKKKK